MHQLKFALGKDDQQKSISRTGHAVKNYNKSNHQSIWALDPDITCGGQQEQQQDNKLTKITQSLQSSLNLAFTKDKLFTEIVQTIQVLLGEDKSQIDCLLLIQKKMNQILDNSREDNKSFNLSFYQLLVKRIKKLKKKQKKSQLVEYDRIIHNNFKKKASVQYINEDLNNRQQYLQVRDNQLSKGMKTSTTFNSNEGSSSKNSNSSNQGKLKGLLSQDKFSLNKADDKDRSDNFNDSVMEANQNVSFSAVISQSMAVRQRSPRVVINTKKEKAKEQLIKNEKEDDKEQGKDQAFIFFRPKKNKRVGH